MKADHRREGWACQWVRHYVSPVAHSRISVACSWVHGEQITDNG